MSQIIIKPNKQRRRYTLEINDDFDIVVRTPLRASKSTIQQLLKEHDNWIQKQIQTKKQNDNQFKEWLDPDIVYFRGKKYGILSSDVKQVQFQSNDIKLPLKLTKQKFLEKQAKLYLPERCLDIAEQMNLNPQKIRIRRMTSCWGTCHRDQSITLNLALIQAPDWVSDYVMIHECAHLVHFNHSSNFWQLVDDYTEHKKSAKKWLKNHQSILLKLSGRETIT